MFLLVPGAPPVCRYAVVPTDVLRQLLPRRQQIGLAEALACLLGPYNFPESFSGRDVIHFIDNMGALAGCITGGSSVPDANCIYQLHALKLAELGCRYWAEFVESAANLADEPSRSGADCPSAASLGAAAAVCDLPPLPDLWRACTDVLLAEKVGNARLFLHTDLD